MLGRAFGPIANRSLQELNGAREEISLRSGGWLGDPKIERQRHSPLFNRAVRRGRGRYRAVSFFSPLHTAPNGPLEG
jgi:hypothetical protein